MSKRIFSLFLFCWLIQTVFLYCLLKLKKNRFDQKRVEEAGPNRACAEWLLKCGAEVKFKNWGSYTTDYNKIPTGGFEAFQIEEIKAVDACIMTAGFEYLSRNISVY